MQRALRWSLALSLLIVFVVYGLRPGPRWSFVLVIVWCVEGCVVLGAYSAVRSQLDRYRGRTVDAWVYGMAAAGTILALALLAVALLMLDPPV